MTDPRFPSRRAILFLQGPPSGFWVDLADAVAARGARVLRVNLCLADRLFWRRAGAVDYRGSLRRWRGWLRAYMRREGVTDVVYYADRLPYHRVAAGLARVEGIGAHAVEFGYLRPDWLTLEKGGGGAYSFFPADPAQLSRGAPAPDFVERHVHGFAREAFGEVLYGLTMVAGRPLYPGYVSDRPVHPVVDYLFWLRKLARSGAARRRAAAVEAAHLGGGAPFWLVGLQLPTDYQLRGSAVFPRQADMARAVVASFAAHAPPGHRLLFKIHPLDNGSIDWAALVAREAAARGVAGRVGCIDGGALGPLIRASQGVVVANSTLGLTALRMGRPVKTLGAAVYAQPGLTHDGPLDGFWTDAAPPDRAQLAVFLAALAAEIQVKGSFYHGEGRRLAAAEMAARLVEGRVGPAAASARPPRAAALRRLRRAVAEGCARP